MADASQPDSQLEQAAASFWDDGLGADSSRDCDSSTALPREGLANPLDQFLGMVAQPMGGGGPDPEPDIFPDLEDLPGTFRRQESARAQRNPGKTQSSGNLAKAGGPEPRSQARTTDRDFDSWLDDIPIEEYSVPAVSSGCPGIRPTIDAIQIHGASARGGGATSMPSPRAAELPLLVGEGPAAGVTGRRSRSRSNSQDFELTDVFEPPGDPCAFISEDELPLKMPKLPFATRLVADVHATPRLQGDGGYSRWLDRRNEGLQNRAGDENNQLALPEGPSLVRSGRDLCHAPGTSRDSEPSIPPEIGMLPRDRNGMSTIPEALKRQRTAGTETVEELRFIPTSSCLNDREDVDEDAFAQELLADSPRNALCLGACRLIPMPGRAGGLPNGANAHPPLSGGPEDDELRALTDFVNGADDALLSYILDQAAEQVVEAKLAPPRQQTLGPGKPLPGQRPGFPLSL